MELSPILVTEQKTFPIRERHHTDKLTPSDREKPDGPAAAQTGGNAAPPIVSRAGMRSTDPAARAAVAAAVQPRPQPMAHGPAGLALTMETYFTRMIDLIPVPEAPPA
jgi:hypothetical protein